MKKRKTVLIVFTAIAIVISIVAWSGNNSNNLEDTDISNIEEITDVNIASIEVITLHNPAQYYTITNQDDIQLLFTTLQSMKLRSKPNSNKDGFAFLIDIKTQNGETINMSILSEDIKINGKTYKPDKDYCDTIRKIFDELSEKYEINPA